MQHADGVFDVAHQRAFGDLQDQPRRRHLVLAQAALDEVGQVGVHQVHGRKIHRHAKVHALGAPAGVLGQGRVEHEAGYFLHESRTFGQRDELLRRHRAQRVVGPAQQGFDVRDLARGQVHLGLEAQAQLVAGDRLAQVAHQRQLAQVHFVPALAIDGHAAAVFLGVVERDVGPAQQGLGVVAVFGVQGQAQAGVEVDAGAGQVQRLAQLVEQHARAGLGEIGVDVVHQHHEFITAQARHQVAGAHGLAQALAHLLQHLVAETVAERVVDFLEPVQVQHQHRRTPRPQGLVQALARQAAVGQAGQAVVVGLVQDALLARGDALLHVAEGRGQPADFVLAAHHDRLAVVAVLDTLGGFGQLDHRPADAAAQETRDQQGQRGRQARQPQDAGLERCIRRHRLVQRPLQQHPHGWLAAARHRQRQHEPVFLAQGDVAHRFAGGQLAGRQTGQGSPRRPGQAAGEHVQAPGPGAREAGVQAGQRAEITGVVRINGRADAHPADAVRGHHRDKGQLVEAAVHGQHGQRKPFGFGACHGDGERLPLPARRFALQAGQPAAVGAQHHRGVGADAAGVVAQGRFHGGRVAAGDGGLQTEVVGQHQRGFQQLFAAGFVETTPDAFAHRQVIGKLGPHAAVGGQVHDGERRQLRGQDQADQQRDDAAVQAQLHQSSLRRLRRRSCRARRRSLPRRSGGGGPSSRASETCAPGTATGCCSGSPARRGCQACSR